MKRIYYLYFIISTLLLSACNDFLDKAPDDTLTIDMVFSDRTKMEQWLAGIYEDIQMPVWSEVYGSPFISDDAQMVPKMAQFDNIYKWIIDNNQGAVSPTGLPGVDYWGNTYKTVRSAFIFMENVKPIPNEGITEEIVERMKSEVRFLICYHYLKMLEMYGPFPLVTKKFESNASLQDMMLPRTPFDEIVNWLDKELVELADYFPAGYREKDIMFGRPTKGACLGLRARLWLLAASPLFNGNPEYADITNKDGTHIFPTKYDPAKWEKAVKSNKDLIDLAETGVYELYVEHYKNGEIDPFMSYLNLFIKSGDQNKELIFTRGKAANHYINQVGNPNSVTVGTGGYFSATLNLADAFFMSNGLSPITGYNSDGSPIINSSSGYTETGFTPSQIIYPNTTYDMGGAGAVEGLVVDKGVSMMYANREPRFYISIWYNNEWIPIGNRKTDFTNGGRDDSTVTGLLIRKGVHPEADPKASKFPFTPGIVMRLGEFYLNYVEALNEYKPGDSDILKYLNKIRERAGIPTYGSGAGQIPAPASQSAMREAIRKERRVELAIEMDIRYNDIRRWLIAEEVFKTPIYRMNRSVNDDTFYQRKVYMNRVFEKKNYLWPIYQQYVENNTNLVQNKYW